MTMRSACDRYHWRPPGSRDTQLYAFLVAGLIFSCLFGNAFAGMVIMGLLYMAAPAVLPAPLHLYFDLFQGLVQSFVFTMLTMVYIQGSMATQD